MKIRTGDRVVVLTGKDRGKEGVVISADPSSQRVTVEGVNRIKRHQKPTRSMQQGGIIEKEAAIHVSNVAIVGTDGKPTRVGYKVTETGEKLRIDRRSGGEL